VIEFLKKFILYGAKTRVLRQTRVSKSATSQSGDVKVADFGTRLSKLDIFTFPDNIITNEQFFVH
jgi:hypothetical protein